MRLIETLNWSPAVLGLLLFIISGIHLYQFDPYTGDVRELLSTELPIAILGFILSVVVFLSTIYWLAIKKWKIAVQTVVSPIIWYGFFVAGSLMGGAYMNAT